MPEKDFFFFLKAKCSVWKDLMDIPMFSGLLVHSKEKIFNFEKQCDDENKADACACKKSDACACKKE